MEIHAKRDEALRFFDLKPGKITLLVLGGSLGARNINQLIDHHLLFFKENEVQLLWQCGKLYQETYEGKSNSRVRVLPFIKRMDLAYAAADIILSRAGALSVSELCIVGKPVIFIPSPNVAEDHQTKNARAVASRKAAILLPESEAKQTFTGMFEALVGDKEKMEQLSKNIKQLARPDATRQIVDEIVKLLPAS